MTTLRVTIRGRVQGVGYRAWTIREARARGIVGWVRNRADGSVEAVFQGREDNVSAMIEACRKGPRLSVVTTVDTEPHPAGPWADFQALATA